LEDGEREERGQRALHDERHPEGSRLLAAEEVRPGEREHRDLEYGERRIRRGTEREGQEGDQCAQPPEDYGMNGHDSIQNIKTKAGTFLLRSEGFPMLALWPD
jgi:hypothetical protein